jgi:hypothetical protein
MNSKILDEVQLLKLYLKRFPQQATELAIAYLEDYLVLESEFNRLTAQLKQLKQSPFTFIPDYPLAEAHLNLEQEFRVEASKIFLAQNISESESWAIDYFQKFLILAQEYRLAEAEFNSLCDRLLAPNQPQLPYFL